MIKEGELALTDNMSVMGWPDGSVKKVHAPEPLLLVVSGFEPRPHRLEV